MKLPFAIALTFAATAPATAIEYKRQSSDGQDYILTCNENGYVLEAPNETVYLGRNCDAFSTKSGAGSWGWANGGFLVDLSGARIGFPRQELYCPTDDNLGDDCRN